MKKEKKEEDEEEVQRRQKSTEQLLACIFQKVATRIFIFFAGSPKSWRSL